MALAFFYLSEYRPGEAAIVLDEDNSRHIIQVLRMQKGQQLQLTDGHGRLLTATIVDDHKKKCGVRVDDTVLLPARDRKITIGMALLKNVSRYEWFLEKATEIGVTGIIPLLSDRTEKQHFRQDRMQHILVSAMLQSRQTWLPVLYPPTRVEEVIKEAKQEQRLIAHCLEGESRQSLAETGRAFDADATGGQLILIGPEGDFTKSEVDAALGQGFLPVMLGGTRLRTETAGVVAAALMCIR
ncbi:MAG TPA: RsmE family RNA methyltransferase [Puia sp.]|jgi:16S rRNA (uracil1498-N3)-methyltransferase|nr:RsmE family RNA methyltransferase [Puia sp.]